MNRLTSVDPAQNGGANGGVDYTWDAKGNLLSDGESTYTYDHANRLSSVVRGPSTFTFDYSGLGDRLRQTVDPAQNGGANGGVATNYALDLNAGLTQVLSDGPNAYLYGLGRIGEEQPGGWQYHLGDALGSVRQLADADGSVRLARGDEPFGSMLTGSGAAKTVYQFAGEQRDATGLIYLRARYLHTPLGRFLTRDNWPSDPRLPKSLHAFTYAWNNPVLLADPSGHLPQIPPTVGETIKLAEFLYSKKGLFDCAAVPDDQMQSADDTVEDLWFDYLCERGPEHRLFTGEDRLTRELADSVLIHVVRLQFYISGGKALAPSEFKFNIPQYGLAFWDLLYLYATQGPPLRINITHFLGSFNQVSVTRLTDGRVLFFVQNRTDRSSGTHIPGRFAPQYTQFLETLVEQDPEIGGQAAIPYILSNPVISLLRPKTRAETVDPEGGGNMRQSFIWRETGLDCGLWLLPWPIVLHVLDVE